MSDTRSTPPLQNSSSETPRVEPQESIGPNPTTREGAAQPRADHREPPMPERPLATDAARGATTTGHMRYVLPISIALAVIALVAALTLT